MKYIGKTIFLVPFIEACSKILDLDKIVQIKFYSVDYKKQEKTLGSTTTQINHKNFKINIKLLEKEYTTGKNGKLHFERNNYAIMYSLLETLAHELAHTKHWKHTPDHYLLQGKIMVQFSKVAKSLGIKDLELRFDEVFDLK
jgi:predicted metal-dependent hydrolase